MHTNTEPTQQIVFYLEVDDYYYPKRYYMTSTSPLRSYPLLARSTRIWREIGNNVEYIKNQHDNSTVDLIEFFWVKLQATAL